MAKIKLEMDALEVESFDTATADAGRGTVQGRQEPIDREDAALIPVTDWKTCQGGDCTARTLCLYSCVEVCLAPGADAFGGG